MDDLAGKRVLITGAARGIGLDMAIAFAEAGAGVALADRDAAALTEAESAVRVLGVPTLAVELDVTSPAAIEAAALAIENDLGPIDVLVNNAGIVHGGALTAVPLERHLATMRVNCDGVIAMTHRFLPGLIARPEAHLVTIASASAFVGLPYGTSYAASKWAALGFTESVRAELRELGHDHVGVTAVCPSYIGTGMFDGVQAPAATRMLEPEFVAGRVVEAVLAGEPYVLEPWLVKLTPALKGVLPTALWDALGSALGVTDSMASWKGREESSGKDPRRTTPSE